MVAGREEPGITTFDDCPSSPGGGAWAGRPLDTRSYRDSAGCHGPSPALCVEQALTLTDDVEQARRVGRKHL